MAGGPSHCENPKTVQDLTLGAYIAVEATLVPGHATFDGLSSVIPLSDVKVLWQAVPNNPTPTSIEADNVPLTDADLVAPPGRYILLLGSGHAGHWYLAMGRLGAFAYVDPQGSQLTQLCVTYTSAPEQAQKAPGSISRTTLMALLKQASLPDSQYSPRP